jgi:ATP-binding cassette subfamily F protein uup
LEDYLDTYEGIVIAVSHDRYFLDRTMRRIFAYEGEGKLRQYEGGYTDYAGRKAEEDALRETKPAPRVENAKTGAAQRSRGSQKLKMSYKEQREYETIEDELASLEERLEEIETEITKNARDYTKLNQLMAEKEEKEALLEEKMDRWMYLEELAAKIADQ